MSYIIPETLERALHAALEYFGGGEESEDNGIIVEQISTGLLMLETAVEIEDGEAKRVQMETVRNIVQNLHLCKIAETGSDLFHHAVPATQVG